MSNRLEKLGLNQTEIKREVKVMDKDTTINGIVQLQDMPIDQFNKLLLQKPDTVVQKEISIVSTTNCSKNDECEEIHIEFKLLFNYEIGGFRTTNYFFTLEKNKNDGNSTLFIKERMLRRKGGLFLMKVQYKHHTTYCQSSYLGSTISRTPYSLLIPNYYNFNEGGLNIEKMQEFFNQLISIRKTEPNIEDMEDIIAEFQLEGCMRDHDDDWCDGDCVDEYGDYTCDRGHYDSAEEYCDDNCEGGKANNLLALMLTHPHFFSNMENFCTGNQFNSNPVLLEMQRYPNPITYIAEMIRVTNDVYLDDSYYSDRYMADVFDNWHCFNIYNRDMARLIEQSQYYSSSRGSRKELSISSSEDHCLTVDCYCMDCMIFRHWVGNGLRFDPSKLIFGTIPEVTLDHFETVIDNHARSDNISSSGRSYLKDLALSIDLSDKKYHISGKSPFNQLDTGYQSRNFEMGLFKRIRDDKTILLGFTSLELQYQKYMKLSTIMSDINNVGEFNFPSDMWDTIKDKLPTMKDLIDLVKPLGIREYLNQLYERVIFEKET